MNVVKRFPVVGGLIVSSLLIAGAEAADYDPLRVDLTVLQSPIDTAVLDTASDRQIPLRIYLPHAPADGALAPAPVVLFSHGLGGSRKNNPYLGEHWSARGYAVVFLQHAGSDESVWKDLPQARIMASLRAAASRENLEARIKDVTAVLDQLADWNSGAQDSSVAKQLAGRLDLAHVGMSGHSFGALTTQAVSGQVYLGGRVTFTDPRIRASVLMSPSSPRLGKPSTAFGKVAIPWLLMTGTHDEARHRWTDT